MKQHSLLVSIFEKYQADLLRFVSTKFGSHHDAEDIVQDTFHNVLRTRDISDIENPLAYLYKTANNLALNRIRSQKLHHSYLTSCENVQESDFSAVEADCFERSLFAQQELERVQTALKKLPYKYRRTFEMSRIDHKTYQEISDELGISVSSVEKHIIKVLQFLRMHCQKESA